MQACSEWLEQMKIGKYEVFIWSHTHGCRYVNALNIFTIGSTVS